MTVSRVTKAFAVAITAATANGDTANGDLMIGVLVLNPEINQQLLLYLKTSSSR